MNVLRFILIFCIISVLSAAPLKSLGVEGASSIPKKVQKHPGDIIKVPPPTTETLKKIPQNLARWYTGASLFVTDPSSSLQKWDYNEARNDARKYALLSDDPSLTFELKRGHHTFIVDLGDQYVLKQFHIKNYTARGTLVVSTSNVLHAPDSPHWKIVGTPTLFKPGEAVVSSLGIAEGRYVKAVLYIQQEGRISPFHISGETPLTVRQVSTGADLGEGEAELVPFNIASLNTGSRVDLINAGDPNQANAVLDEDPETSYDIPPRDQPAYILIDLQDYHNVHRVALDIEGDPGLLNFYLFNEPPDFAEEEKDGSSDEAVPDQVEAEDAIKTSLFYMRPSLLLVAEEGSLGESLALSGLSEQEQARQNFFQRLTDREPDFSGASSGNDTQVKFDFPPMRARFLLIEWIQDGDTTTPGLKGLKIREVAIMSEIPAPDYIQPPAGDYVFSGQTTSNDPDPDPKIPPLYEPPTIPPGPPPPPELPPEFFDPDPPPVVSQ